MDKKIKNIEEIIKNNKKLNFVLSKINYKIISLKNGKLSGLCYAIKDNISMKDTVTTGGSIFLKNYVSPYSATVINLLSEEGAIPLIKTNLDEFGLGGTGTFSGFGNVLNPYDNKRIVGGSSSGSAVAVAIDACDFALGTDTGDSIRRPASFTGIIGYKPTYGLISRYGVFPYAPSLDHVGLLSKNIDIISLVMSVIAKKDYKDFSSQNVNIIFSNISKFNKDIKIAIIDDVFDDIDKSVVNLFNNSIKKIQDVIFSKVNFGELLLKSIPSVYKIISYAEAVSSYQNMTGINFGESLGGNNFEEIIRKNRTSFFGEELKRRFIIGSFCTSGDNYKDLFLKSKKIRTLIIDRSNEIFKNNDFIISIGSSNIAPLIQDVKNKKNKDKKADHFLQVANFGGFPSITLPLGEISNMPIGINITGKLNSDNELLALSKKIIRDLKVEIKYV